MVWLALITVPAGAEQGGALNIELQGGQVVSEEDTFRFDQGEEIHIRWTSDENVELHLHGYDLIVTAGPGIAASMRFTATVSGRFPVTSHGAGSGPDEHRTLIYIEIHPR